MLFVPAAHPTAFQPEPSLSPSLAAPTHHPAPCPAPPAFPSLAFLCHPCRAAEPCFSPSSPSPEEVPGPRGWKRLGHEACSSLTVMFCSCPTQTKQRGLQHSCVTRNPVLAKIPNHASPRCTLTDQLASGAIAKPFPQEVTLQWYCILTSLIFPLAFWAALVTSNRNQTPRALPRAPSSAGFLWPQPLSCLWQQLGELRAQPDNLELQETEQAVQRFSLKHSSAFPQRGGAARSP